MPPTVAILSTGHAAARILMVGICVGSSFSWGPDEFKDFETFSARGKSVTIGTIILGMRSRRPEATARYHPKSEFQACCAHAFKCFFDRINLSPFEEAFNFVRFTFVMGALTSESAEEGLLSFHS